MIATPTRASAAGTRYQPVPGRNPLTWAFLDAMVLAKRSLLQTLRVPELIVFVTIQPVMFVLLFRYVFGGAIHVPGGQYVNFLMPGIFVQTVAFGGVTTGIGLAEDMQRGLIDRFPDAADGVVRRADGADHRRPWPKPLHRRRHAGGRVRGWLSSGRHDFRVSACAAGLDGVQLFALLHKVSAFIGLAVRSAEAAQSGGFIWLFPLTFASSAFVPVETMPKAGCRVSRSTTPYRSWQTHSAGSSTSTQT